MSLLPRFSASDGLVREDQGAEREQRHGAQEKVMQRLSKEAVILQAQGTWPWTSSLRKVEEHMPVVETVQPGPLRCVNSNEVKQLLKRKIFPFFFLPFPLSPPAIYLKFIDYALESNETIRCRSWYFWGVVL